jgi:hypothetical protein
MSTTTTTATTTPALNSYLPVLARLLMCSSFIWGRRAAARQHSQNFNVRSELIHSQPPLALC